MASNEPQRSPELDRARELLFPNLAPEVGWQRIDAALAGAADDEWWNRVELLADDQQDFRGAIDALLARRHSTDHEPPSSP